MMNTLSYWYRRRDLLRYLVVSKLKIGQKEMLLGYVWWIVEPLLLMLIYWLLVVVIFQRGGPDYPLFVLCGLIPFRATAVSLSQSVTALSGKFSLLNQLNFPRIFLPISDVIANHIKLIFGLVVVIIFAGMSTGKFHFTWIFLIFPFLIHFLLISGLAAILSISGAYFRDLKNLTQFFIRILLYLSPVIYSIDRIPKEFTWIYLLNPFASLTIIYRGMIMDGVFPTLFVGSVAVLESVLIFTVGYVTFHLNERKILRLL